MIISYNEVTLITTNMKLDIKKLEIERNKLNIAIREYRNWSVFHKNIKEFINERNRITKQLSVLYFRNK